MRKDLTILLAEQFTNSEEKVIVRKINILDDEEKIRLEEIDRDGEVKDFLVIDKPFYDLSDVEKINYAEGNPTSITLAISGKGGWVENEEVGKLQGELFVYYDSEIRAKEILENGWIDDKDRDSAIEIGFAKYPKAKGHQISSALRLVLELMINKLGREIVVSAYTDKRNEKSRFVLESAGFRKVGEMVYDPKINNEPDWVFLYQSSDKDKRKTRVTSYSSGLE